MASNNRRQFLGASAAGMGALLTPAGAAAQTRKPNVVLFISDQQRADTMPGARAVDARTPHLEWLYNRGGAMLRNAHCAYPICSPSRGALLSGLYPHTTGVVANHQNRPIANQMHLPKDIRVLADFFEPAGYHTGYFGKWHLGTGPDRRGFRESANAVDHDVDNPEQNDMVLFARKIGLKLGGKQSGLDPDPKEYNEKSSVGPSLLPLAYHPSTLMADRAADFIRRHASSPQPFLLTYSCHEPHPPFTSPRPFHGMYDAAKMPLPDTLNDPEGPARMRRRPDGQLKSVENLSEGELRSRTAAYYGAVSFVDHLFGQILTALVDTGSFDNTLIIFTSDHGEMLGHHGLSAKGAVFYDDLTNIPLLIHPPGGLRAPRQCNRLVSLVDLVPTILNWCDLPVPSGLHGNSIRPLVEGDDRPVNHGVAFEFHSNNWGDRTFPMRGWRTEEWKYVETLAGDNELYDLRQDPHELRNLYGKPEAAPAQRSMKEGLHSWMKRTNDAWPKVPMPPSVA